MSGKTTIFEGSIGIAIHQIEDRGKTFYRVVLMSEDNDLGIHVVTYQDFVSLDRVPEAFGLMRLPSEPEVISRDLDWEVPPMVNLPARSALLEVSNFWDEYQGAAPTVDFFEQHGRDND